MRRESAKELQYTASESSVEETAVAVEALSAELERSPTLRRDLEQRLIDALKGPRTVEYYQAINTLAALRSTNALPALRNRASAR